MRLLDSTRTTFGVKISDRIWRDSNGQLVCRDCIIARTGSYDYLESEIIEGGDRNKIVKVFRTDDEVFDPTSIASFENKPFVDDHPQENVSLDNYKDLSKGYMYNVRQGEGELNNCLICDLVVTDAETIEKIVSGEKRELSLGYDTVIVNRGGNYYMTNIRGNHLALVDDGRAGCATIRDSVRQIKDLGGITMKSKVKLFDEDVFEVEEIPETEVVTEVPQEESIVEEKHDDEPTLAEIKAMLVEIKEMLATKASDEEVAPVEEKKEEVVEEGIVGDEDPEAEAEVVPAEETAPIEEQATEAEDCGGKLLDADEIVEEEVKTKDAKSVYSKFAKIGDAKSTITADAVNSKWQERYNRAAGKNV